MSHRILTGLQANSTLHIGNYLGGMLPMVQLQKSLQEGDQMFMFVPNLHSFTLPIDHSKLYQQTLNNVRYYMAAGIDVESSNTFLYRQSEISAHSELAWILSCFAYMGEMNRMTQFKDKSNTHENVSVGLFTYPILMAADILLYGAEYVPVGDDQKQHLELARDIAIRMNNRFSKDQMNRNYTFMTSIADDIFVIPREWQFQLKFRRQSEGIRIRSLSNPEKKMSKSVSDPKGTILLTDTPQEAHKKIMSATTDNEANIRWDWQNQPGITNLLQLNYLLSGNTKDEVVNRWVGETMYGPLKQETAELVADFLNTIQTNISSIYDEQVESVLARGEEKARVYANQTLTKVQKKLGLKI
jgi:tryptophanyl-tRNA synthetase